MSRGIGASWAALICALSACIETPDFPNEQLVDGPRVLAVVAEPPEVPPGADVRLSALVAGTEVTAVTWQLCAAFYTFSGNQYDEGLDDDGCAGSLRVPLLSDPLAPNGAIVPGVATETLFDDRRGELESLIFGLSLPPGVLDTILNEVGVPILAEATVTTPAGELHAVKRILFSLRETGNHNPPPPRLYFGDTLVAHEDGFECTAEGGGPLRLSAGEEVEVEPALPGKTESWLEDYTVLDARGELVPRTERAYYTFFATGGEFESQTTSSPLRNNRFRAPSGGGRHNLWVVLRDGHGGTSACRIPLEVTRGDVPDGGSEPAFLPSSPGWQQ